MAEVLAIAGGISAFAEISSYLMKGCLSFQELVRDAKTAPADVRSLIEELATTEKTAKGIAQIVQDTRDQELRTKVYMAVRLPFERCVKVVSKLKNVLLKHETGLNEAGARMWWEKFKVVKEKKAVSKLVDEIQRAKSDLLLASESVSLIAMESQRVKFDNISQSIDLVLMEDSAIATKLDDTLSQGKMVLEIAETTKEKIHDSEIWQARSSTRQEHASLQLSQILQSQNRNFNKVSQSVSDIHGSNLNIAAKLDDSSRQGEAILMMTQRNNQATTNSLEAIQRQIENMPATLMMMMAQAFEAGTVTNEQIRLTQARSNEIMPEIVSHNSIIRQQSSNPRRYPCQKLASRKTYIRNRYLHIASEIWEDCVNEELSIQNRRSPKYTEIRIVVQSILPFLKRAFYYTKTDTAWDPLYEAKIKSVRLFTRDSAIGRACRVFDLDHIRRLFTTGEASPLMEDEHGHTIVDFSILVLALKLEDRNITSIMEAVRLIEFMFDACKRSSVRVSPSTLSCLLLSFVTSKKYGTMEGINRIVKLILENSSDNPLDDSRITSCIEINNIQHPLITTVTQQNLWPINLTIEIQNGLVRENMRQMLEDPKGERLKETLQDANNYIPGKFSRGFCGIPICNLLITASRTTRIDLQECCKNRIRLLISTPEFDRFNECRLSETMDPDYMSDFPDLTADFYIGPGLLFVGRVAIRAGVRHLLEDVLRKTGWRDFEIDDFFDTETYYHLPKLLNGEILYQSSRETQREFVLGLCDGAFAEMSDIEIDSLACRMNLTLKPSIVRRTRNQSVFNFGLLLTIGAANTAFVSRTTPGSWPMEDKTRLLPGVDFEVSAFCQPYVLFWYHCAILHEPEEECACKEYNDIYEETGFGKEYHSVEESDDDYEEEYGNGDKLQSDEFDSDEDSELELTCSIDTVRLYYNLL